jgi:hypothetical protein
MNRPSLVSPAVAVFLFAATGACRHGASPGPSGVAQVPTPPPVTSLPSSSVGGDVAVQFLADPTAPKPKLVENEEFTPASPRSMPPPTYPPAALRAGVPPAVVAVRLMIDPSGSVYAVKDSPRLASSQGPFSTEFREAVEVAVRRWVFSGARIDTVAPLDSASSSTSPRPLMSARWVPTFLDFSFQFRVLEGRGVVSVGSPIPSQPSETPKP